MEQQIWSDFLIKQLPVIIVLSIFCYYMYGYFTKALDKKDLLLKDKDEEIKDLHEKLLTLTRQFMDSTNKNTEVISNLQRVIDIAANKLSSRQ